MDSTVAAAILVGLTLYGYVQDWRWKRKVNKRLERIETELNNLKKAA